MNELVKKSIDGKEYIFARLPVKHSLKQLIKIMKIAGPAIGAAANTKGVNSVSSIMDSDVDIESVMKNLCDHLEEDSVFEIIDIFMANILFEGNKLIDIFDPHFGEHGLIHLGKVIIEATKAEYGDFFGGKLGGLMAESIPGMTPEK